MKNILKFSLILFCFLLFLQPIYSANFWQSFYKQFYENIFPNNTISQINNSGEILLGNLKPTSTTVENWQLALETTTNKGTTWIGKLESNGINDDFQREEKGRDIIVFAPYTDFSKPIDIIYFFHGIQGFCDKDTDKFGTCGVSDMKDRIISQSNILVNRGRNIVIVYPEMPWSAGTAKDNSRRNGRQSGLIWEEKDSDLAQLHKDVLDIIKTKFNTNNNITINNIEMTGHSAGGAAIAEAALKPTIQNNYLMQIKPNILKLSDGDYCWIGGNSATNIYQNYLKQNSSAQLYLIVQSPNLISAHEPTANAIVFYKNVNNNTCYRHSNLPNIKTMSTNIPKDNENYIPNTNNQVIYIPLNKGHLEIGKTSLAYYISNYAEYTPNKTNLTLNQNLLFPLTNNSFKYISYNFTQYRAPTATTNKVRCHGGIDLYTTEDAKVQAITDGEIIHLYENFANCSGGWGAAIYVYHPKLNKTILYGEVNATSIATNPRTDKKWAVGDSILKGDILGKATVCGMLHLELHDGKRPAERWSYDSGNWVPQNNINNYENCIATLPKNLLNPTTFLNNILYSPENQYLAQIQKEYESSRTA